MIFARFYHAQIVFTILIFLDVSCIIKRLKYDNPYFKEKFKFTLCGYTKELPFLPHQCGYPTAGVGECPIYFSFHSLSVLKEMY